MLTQNDLVQIREIVREEITPLKKDVLMLKGDAKTLRKDMKRVQNDIRTIISMFDREYIDLEKRTRRIEKHLHLPPV